MRTTPHATSPEPSALALGVGQSIEAIAPSLSGSDFIPHSITTFDVPPAALNLYRILQQEVDIGVQALERESADMAVTFFQSALQKMTVDQPLYDHLVHNLLPLNSRGNLYSLCALCGFRRYDRYFSGGLEEYRCQRRRR